MLNSPIETEYQEYLALLSRYCQSQPGKERILSLRPDLTESEILKSWELILEGKKVLMAVSSPPLSGHLDLSALFERAEPEGAIMEVEELLLVQDEALCSRAVKGFFRPLGETAPGLAAMASELGDSEEFISAMESSISPEGEILESASPELRRLRRDQMSLRQAILLKLGGLLKSAEYSSIVRDDIITTRQDRYVIRVRSGGAGKSRGLVHDWSKTGSTAYLEPLETIDDNNKLNFLRSQEQREIERILLKLSELSRAASHTLKKDAIILSRLDEITASARIALDFNASAPHYEKGGGYHLKALRHPLLEERLRTEKRQITPIDIIIDPNSPMLIISGLNTGGKTIALKALGLNALIAKSGLLVHCKEGSHLDFPSKVLSVMGDNQDLASDLSTFSGHIMALREVLERIDKDSLVLLDELGNGTDPQEGAALALAVLEHLRDFKCAVVSATHFHLVKAWAVLTEGVVPVAVNSTQDGSPAYGLSYGNPGFSGGLNMAERLGLPPFLVKRAKDLLDDGYQKANELLASLDAELSRVKSLRESLEEERISAAHLRESLNEKHNREIERLNREARRQDQEIKMALNRYRHDFDSLREDFKRAKEAKVDINPMELSLKKSDMDKSLEAIRPQILEKEDLTQAPTELKEGDRVFIKKLGQTGTVLYWNPEKMEGLVKSQSVRIKVDHSDLFLPQSSKDDDAKGTRIQILATPGASDLTSLKLLGFTVEDAIGEIDREIDRAILGGRKKLTIIHGMGSGRLKNGITAFLKKHPRVVDFGSPTQIPGGQGVTEVILDS